MLRERLIQCGWRDDLKEFCKDVIRRKGLEKVTIEELVSEITPKGRGKNNCTNFHNNGCSNYYFICRHIYSNNT
jgi:hypothetical protein